MTDLTKLDRPLGEYDDAVIGALVRAWQSGAVLQCRIGDGDDWGGTSHPSFRMVYSYRLDPEPLRPASPPWNVLPEWVQAVARDEDGDEIAYDTVPKCGDTRWFNRGAQCILINLLRFDRGNMPWDQSLVLRPEGV